MNQKKICVIAPIMSSWCEIDSLKDSLAFLARHYEMTFLDPLEFIKPSTTLEDFLSHWEKRLICLAPEFDLFIGFSMGGAILQQFLAQLEKNQARVILISTPSFINEDLFNKLSEVISLCQGASMDEALRVLYQYVMYPYDYDASPLVIHDEKTAALRIAKGLSLFLAMHRVALAQVSSFTYLHLIGEKSALVNADNVNLSSQVVIVPKVGMRVLSQAADFCQTKILNYLTESLCSA